MSDQVRPQGAPQTRGKGATRLTAAAAAIAAPGAGKVPAPAPAVTQVPLPRGKTTAQVAPAQVAPAQMTVRGTRPSDLIEPVRAKAPAGGSWTEYLVLFLRVMAAVSLVKGLYHWSQICSIGAAPDQVFEMQSTAWRSVTVFFAVIDLVAAVGLWLAAPWGAVVWLTSTVSMAMVELFFPGVYGGSAFVVLTEIGLLGVYLWLAIIAARERPA
jgi:hypothetical protein